MNKHVLHNTTLIKWLLITICVLASLSILSSLHSTLSLLASSHQRERHVDSKIPRNLVPIDIAKWHLFGASSASDIPASNLGLKVIGIDSSSAPNKSTAIIATASGEQAVYGVGDTLPGGSVISNITPDAVIIRREGRLESLLLPRIPLPLESSP